MCTQTHVYICICIYIYIYTLLALQNNIGHGWIQIRGNVLQPGASGLTSRALFCKIWMAKDGLDLRKGEFPNWDLRDLMGLPWGIFSAEWYFSARNVA